MFSPFDTPETVAEAARPTWRAAARRAVDLAVAFFTLEDHWEASGAREPVAGAAPHPHRQPLRTARRARRPGAVAARQQACLTPVSRRAEAPLQRPAAPRAVRSGGR